MSGLPVWATAASGECGTCRRFPAVASVVTLAGARLVCGLCLDLERAARGDGMTFGQVNTRWQEATGEQA